MDGPSGPGSVGRSGGSRWTKFLKADPEILVAFKPVTRFWTWFLQAFFELISAFLLQQNERTLLVIYRIITFYKK